MRISDWARQRPAQASYAMAFGVGCVWATCAYALLDLLLSRAVVEFHEYTPAVKYELMAQFSVAFGLLLIAALVIYRIFMMPVETSGHRR